VFHISAHCLQFLQARLFQEEDSLVMKAIKPIQAGEEIFNDYGELPRADLLRRYGYVTANYAQYDVVELSLDQICRSAGLQSADIESHPPVLTTSSIFRIPTFSAAR
jgi:SET domain-containing protein 6